MLSEKNLLKPLIEEFLINGLDLTAVDEEKKRVPIETFVVKNNEGRYVIFDNNFSVEVNFEEDFLENFIEKYTIKDFEELIQNNTIHINKYRIDIYLERTNHIQMMIEEFDISPAKNNFIYFIHPNINTDVKIKSLSENIIKQTKFKDIQKYDKFEVFNCSQGSDDQDIIITEENLAHIDLSKILIEPNTNHIKENPFLNENSNNSNHIKTENQVNERIDENSNKVTEENLNQNFDQQEINRFYHIFEENNIINKREENNEKSEKSERRLPEILIKVKEKYKDVIPYIKKDVIIEYMKLFDIHK